ncbi:MAG: hypothetical protein FJZ64_00635 [Chlamydiae bacterium]|nr:hypothetical protein [Chlamydiota bacterium]
MDKESFHHLFLFSSGHWQGEGKIRLNMVEEELLFNTHWNVEARDFAGKISAAQEIQVQGLTENMRNELSFYDFHPTTFCVEMENQNLGKIAGTGLFDTNMIAWEFRNNDMEFEGYETYTLQPDGSYHMHGEYVTSDQFRTQIQARLWKREEIAEGEGEGESEEDEG